MKKYSSLICVSVLASYSLSAQVPFYGSYIQDFDDLPTAATSVRATSAEATTWVDNSTLPGWYAAGTDFLSTISIHNGSDDRPVGQNGSAPGSLGSFDSTDRALAPLRQNRLSYVGLRLVNSTAITIPDVTISFTGEQWRQNGDVARTLFFTYQLGAESLTAGTWTPVTQLDFTGPKIGSAGALNGNLPENQVQHTHTITGINWAPGQELWLRWANTSANNPVYLGIDDLSVIPEPSTYAALLGLLALGVVVLRRRRKA